MLAENKMESTTLGSAIILINTMLAAVGAVAMISSSVLNSPFWFLVIGLLIGLVWHELDPYRVTATKSFLKIILAIVAVTLLILAFSPGLVATYSVGGQDEQASLYSIVVNYVVDRDRIYTIFIYFLVMMTVMIAYVFSLYKGFDGDRPFVRKFFPGKSESFYNWMDFGTGSGPGVRSPGVTPAVGAAPGPAGAATAAWAGEPGPQGCGVVPGAGQVVGSTMDLCAGRRRRAHEQCSGACPATGGAVAQGQLRGGQRGRRSVCRAAARLPCGGG
jgi:hypothetical protein